MKVNRPTLIFLFLIAINISAVLGASFQKSFDVREIDRLKQDRSFLEKLLDEDDIIIESCESSVKESGICKFSGNVLVTETSNICICEESVKTKTIQKDILNKILVRMFNNIERDKYERCFNSNNIINSLYYYS